MNEKPNQKELDLKELERILRDEKFIMVTGTTERDFFLDTPVVGTNKPLRHGTNNGIIAVTGPLGEYWIKHTCRFVNPDNKLLDQAVLYIPSEPAFSKLGLENGIYVPHSNRSYIQLILEGKLPEEEINEYLNRIRDYTAIDPGVANQELERCRKILFSYIELDRARRITEMILDRPKTLEGIEELRSLIMEQFKGKIMKMNGVCESKEELMLRLVYTDIFTQR